MTLPFLGLSVFTVFTHATCLFDSLSLYFFEASALWLDGFAILLMNMRSPLSSDSSLFFFLSFSDYSLNFTPPLIGLKLLQPFQAYLPLWSLTVPSAIAQTPTMPISTYLNLWALTRTLLLTRPIAGFALHLVFHISNFIPTLSCSSLDHSLDSHRTIKFLYVQDNISTCDEHSHIHYMHLHLKSPRT